jgi:hypothetical protein
MRCRRSGSADAKNFSQLRAFANQTIVLNEDKFLSQATIGASIRPARRVFSRAISA